MLLSGYVTGNGCIVMERRIWYNDLKEKVEKTQIINRSWMIISMESKMEKDLYEKHHMLQFTAK